MKTPQDRGREFEKKFAKKLGTKPTIGSGNLWFQKGDVPSKYFLFQLKYTEKDSMILKAQDLSDIRRQAIESKKYPGMAIQIHNKKYIIIDADWLDFIEDNLEK